MQNLRSERPPRGLAISRKAWKGEGPIRLPCEHPRLSGMDPPCPIRCVPAPWAAYATESGPFLATRHNAPPSPRTSDRTSTNPTAHSHPASASAVYVRIPSTMEHHRESPDSSFTIKNTPDGPEHLSKGSGYIRPEVDRLESGDEIEGRIGIGQPGNIPLPHFAAPGGDGSGVLPEAGGDALSGKIDPADRPLRAEFQKLRQIRPAAASYIEHPGVWLRRHMRPTPLRQRSVPTVHSPQHDPSG